MIDFISSCVSEVRYLEGGREYPNLDCYGLALYVRDKLGLPDLPSHEAARRDVDMDSKWQELASGMSECGVEDGAIIACYSNAGLVIHVAVALSGMVLECNPKRHASLCKLEALRRRFKRLEFRK